MNNRTQININTWNRAELFKELINMRTSIYVYHSDGFMPYSGNVNSRCLYWKWTFRTIMMCLPHRKGVKL